MLAAAKAQIDLACAGAPAGNFVRNSAACNKYYYCNGEIARAGSCPPNFWFKAQTQMCHDVANVDCTECSRFGIQHIEDPLGCSSYYRCVNGQRSRIPCAPGLLFDREFGECVVGDTNHFCYSSMCAPYAGYVKLGDPKNCHVYVFFVFCFLVLSDI